jgi:2-aminoethylphosphonate-pyruvate transaminase
MNVTFELSVSTLKAIQPGQIPFILIKYAGGEKGMNEHYLLLTPGPLTTTQTVKETMLKDWCTWDNDYKQIVQEIRSKLLSIACANPEQYTAVLMQGSGTFGVEAVLGTVVPREGKLLILSNGAYGDRLQEIARVLSIRYAVLQFPPNLPINNSAVGTALKQDEEITHVAFVHCETTTGILNPLESVVQLCKQYGKIVIVDAMSSFGGIPIDLQRLNIDFMISSANKCIQGVPGFSFILCNINELSKLEGQARSLSLNLYDQWKVMEAEQGKWRYTSPTHTVRAFYQALLELEDEGGVELRYARYRDNQILLVESMKRIGLSPYLPDSLQSPFITTFKYPEWNGFTFESFYQFLKNRGFVIYPGKLTDAEVFRIGTMGDVHKKDIKKMCVSAEAYMNGDRE